MTTHFRLSPNADNEYYECGAYPALSESSESQESETTSLQLVIPVQFAESEAHPASFELRKIHHFGVGEKLLEELQLKYQNSSHEMFCDVYFDTEEFTLAKQNLWLRVREFEEEADVDAEDNVDVQSVWSLKKCNVNDSTTDIHVFEYSQNDSIIQILNAVLKDFVTDGSSMCDDPIIGKFHLIPIGIFPTHRIVLKKNPFKFYVDCSGINFSKKFCLVGGISFSNENDMGEMDSFLIHSDGYYPGVRSKIVEELCLYESSLYQELQENNIVHSSYTSAHVRDGQPSLPLPPVNEGK